MIAKIGKGTNLYGAITYNLHKVADDNGKILGLENIPETLDGKYSASYFMKCFDPYLSANNKTEKPIRHISLNPDPKDKLKDDDLIAIAKEYMDKMEFGHQPYIIFKHTDIERTHLHIVTTCVKSNGKKISDYKDHSRSMAICRNIEKSYGLLSVDEKSVNSELVFRPVDYNIGNIKSQISSVIRYLPNYYKFQTLGAYNALLSIFNISAEEVRGEIHGEMKSGLVYFALNASGEKISNPFKSSLFGKKAGLKFLNDHFISSKIDMKSSSAKAILRDTCESVLSITSNEHEFKKQLVQHGINVVIRKNDEGRIYGVTFIDHESRTIWNGSQLGKHLSANIFNENWFQGESFKPDDSECSLGQAQPLSVHQLFDFNNSYVVDNIIDDFGSIISGSQSDDYEEIEFEKRMKRKKKDKRRKI